MRNWVYENITFLITTFSQQLRISRTLIQIMISLTMKTSLIISIIILGQGLSLFSLLLKVYLLRLLRDRTKTIPTTNA